MNRSIVRNLLILAVLAAVAWCATIGWQMRAAHQAYQELKQDYAYIIKIDFGLFNIKEWRDKALSVFTDQIQQFEISEQAYTEVEKELEKYLHQINRDYVANGRIFDPIFEEAQRNEKVNKVLLNMLQQNVGTEIQKLNIPKFIPGMAVQLAAELKKNEPRIKEVMQAELRRMMTNTNRYPQVDPREAVYKKYGQTDLDAAKAVLRERIDSAEVQVHSLILKVYAGLLGLVLFTGLLFRLLGFRPVVSIISVISVLFLVLGIALPMIDIDARMNSFVFSLFDQDLTFDEQSVFYQSKSILQVTETLLDGRTIDLKIVGVLILLFSIVFPAIKLFLSSLFLYSERLQNSRFVRGLIFHLGKWSMADVFVVALFMAYIGFYGLVDAQLGQIEQNKGGFGIETVNYSSLAPGALFFTTYCILSIITGLMINRFHEKKAEIVEG